MSNHAAHERTSTLWAVTEGGLGGFFHAIRSPFTGLLVGGLAVVYISLIALVARASGKGFLHRAKTTAPALGRALVFVLAVKAVAAPHSPVAAYFAVSLQAALGMAFFTFIGNFRVAAMITAVGATVSSAAQKLLILAVVFGTPLFEAFDQFVLDASKKLGFLAPDSGADFSASLWLASLYVGVYATGGLLIGWYAGQVPRQLEQKRALLANAMRGFDAQAHSTPEKRQRLRHRTRLVFAALAALAFALEYAFISGTAAWLQLARTIVIVMLWTLIVQPAIRYFIRKKAAQNHGLAQQAEALRATLPTYAAYARFAWRASASLPGLRVNNFLLLLLADEVKPGE